MKPNAPVKSLSTLILMMASFTAQAQMTTPPTTIPSPGPAAGAMHPMEQKFSISDGGYRGMANKGDKVHILFKKNPGNNAGAIAILFHQGQQQQMICAYVVDPTDDRNEYNLTPLQVTATGELGRDDANPSLTMSVIKGGRDPIFNITNANSSNRACFQGSANFKGRDSKFELYSGIRGGYYKMGSDRNAVVISQPFVRPGDTAHEATITLNAPFLTMGKFSIYESAPGLFGLRVRSATDSGNVQGLAPSYIGFYASTCWGKYLFLVTRSDSGNVSRLKAQSR
jgi:hypothetical protein